MGAFHLFVSRKLCGHNCWELSAWFPAAGKQRGRGWAVPVCRIAAKGGFALHAQELLPWTCRFVPCLHSGRTAGPCEDGEGSNGLEIEGGSVDAAFGAESASRDGFGADPCICYAGLQGHGTKALGAGTAPACSTGTERAVTLMCRWAGRAQGAGLLLRVPASVSVCLPPLRGCWQLSVLAQLSPAMALCRQSLGTDSARAFLGFPGIALSCPGLS